jgi:hypothetical protein
LVEGWRLEIASLQTHDFLKQKGRDENRLGLENYLSLHNIHSGGAPLLGRTQIEPRRVASE